jgi:hypothetical protein
MIHEPILILDSGFMKLFKLERERERERERENQHAFEEFIFQIPISLNCRKWKIHARKIVDIGRISS